MDYTSGKYQGLVCFKQKAYSLIAKLNVHILFNNFREQIEDYFVQNKKNYCTVRTFLQVSQLLHPYLIVLFFDDSFIAAEGLP